MRALQLALISITIHTNNVQKTVNAHEVPILKLIHGDDDRCVVLEENAGSVGMDITNEEEYARLMQVYGKYTDIVRHVYRNPKELGEAIGDEDFIPDVEEAGDELVKAVTKTVTKKAVKKAPSKRAKAQ
jgi:hypothetical protein